jgi:hypothetical protein
MTPDLFDPVIVGANPQLEIILVQLLRGMCDNGLMANLHNEGWHNHIMTRLRGLSPDLQHRVIECLNTLYDRNRLVTHPAWAGGDPADDHDWLDLALTSHRVVPFYSIFLSQPLLSVYLQRHPAFNEPACIEFSGALNSPLWRGRTQTLQLTQSLADYRRALTPILRHARALTLVDPYLNPYEDRFFDTVDLCAQLLGQRGFNVRPGRIHIHAGDPTVSNARNREAVSKRLAAWAGKLQPLVGQYGHRFKVFLWGKHPGGERFHDRYILTDQCGISVPGGLDYGNPPGRTTWTLLDNNTRINRLQDYDPPTSPFNFLGDREIM